MAIPPTGIFSWNNIHVEDHHTLFHLRSICPYYLQAARLFECNLSYYKGSWLMLIGALRKKRLKNIYLNAIERAHPSTREEYIPSSSWRDLSHLEKT
jgi:hypothetical protein